MEFWPKNFHVIVWELFDIIIRYRWFSVAMIRCIFVCRIPHYKFSNMFFFSNFKNRSHIHIYIFIYICASGPISSVPTINRLNVEVHMRVKCDWNISKTVELVFVETDRQTNVAKLTQLVILFISFPFGTYVDILRTRTCIHNWHFVRAEAIFGWTHPPISGFLSFYFKSVTQSGNISPRVTIAIIVDFITLRHLIRF